VKLEQPNSLFGEIGKNHSILAWRLEMIQPADGLVFGRATNDIFSS